MTFNEWTASDVAAQDWDWVVVGCGLTGASFARGLVDSTDARVLVVDRREHIGGNVYDYTDSSGVRVQRYGAHIFHTSSEPVWRFLSRFTDWYPYRHRVMANVSGQLVPLPFNFTALEQLMPAAADRLRGELAAEFPGQARVPVEALLRADRASVRDLGEFLLDTLFRNYSAKQWGRPIEEIDASVLARVPVTLSDDADYFRDRYQAIPAHGYTAMVERMLDHPAIGVALGADGRAVIDARPSARVLWTGQIDEFFERRFGALPYRSLRFDHRIVAGWRTQPVSVINHPGDEPFTRIIEHTHFSSHRTEQSTLTYEYPADYVSAKNEPFYPVVDDESRQLYARYEAAAAELGSRVQFAGRLGDFKYYDMHQAVARALVLVDNVRSEGRLPVPAGSNA
jgi:UDP-galactopyranose mutase